MKSFLEYITESKNTHMTHLEDAVIYGGVVGARDAIRALISMRNMLAGHSSTQHKATVKWDGAPAIFAGQDPTDGQFFVAKKGVFNKDPKVYKTKKEIDADLSGDLAKKFHHALVEFSKLGIKGVIQGDLMFTKGDLGKEKIDGESYITMHPNTIVYAVPADSETARKLIKANIGVVWHTSYEGATFETMKASFGVDVSKLNQVPTVWQQDAFLTDLSGSATMTAKQTAAVDAALGEAGKLFGKISSSTLKQIEYNQEFARTIETFNNTFIRSRTEIKDTKKHVTNLIKWAQRKFNKEIASRKSEKGKTSQKEKRDAYIKFFTNENKDNLKKIFDLQNVIVRAKDMIVHELDQLKNIGTFIKTTKGFRVTKGEGFVAIDHLSGGAYKLVDRLEFSSNNFDPDIIKGWDK